MEWLNKRVQVGEVTVGKAVTVRFQATGDIMQIRELESTCGCSKPSWDKENNQIVVVYTPQPVPKHLAAKGDTSYSVMKGVLVQYLDAPSDILHFSARVNKK